MRTPKFISIATVIFAVIIVSFSGGSTKYRDEVVEIEHEITLPEYRSDAARAIDAYERTMNRYMSLTEKNLTMVSADMRSLKDNMNSIDDKLDKLSLRLARIEQALGIAPIPEPVEKGKAEQSPQRADGRSNTTKK